VVVDGDTTYTSIIDPTKEFCLTTGTGSGLWGVCGTTNTKYEWDTKFCDGSSVKSRCRIAGTKTLLDDIADKEDDLAAAISASSGVAAARTALRTSRNAAGEYESDQFCFRGSPAGASNPTTTQNSIGTDFMILANCGTRTYANSDFCPDKDLQGAYTFTGLLTAWIAADAVSTVDIGGLELTTATSGNTTATFIAALTGAFTAAIAAEAGATATAADTALATVARTLRDNYWWVAGDNDLVAYTKTTGPIVGPVPEEFTLGGGSGTALLTGGSLATAKPTQTTLGLTANVPTATSNCANGGNGGTAAFNTSTPAWSCNNLTATNITANSP
jgi:hypothetical protein